MKKWSSAYPHGWGKELFNRAVNIQNPFFKKLFSPVMDELTKGDRERSSMFIFMALKARININAMKLMMKSDYLVFMNITL